MSDRPPQVRISPASGAAPGRRGLVYLRVLSSGRSWRDPVKFCSMQGTLMALRDPDNETVAPQGPFKLGRR